MLDLDVKVELEVLDQDLQDLEGGTTQPMLPGPQKDVVSNQEWQIIPHNISCISLPSLPALTCSKSSGQYSSSQAPPQE